MKLEKTRVAAFACLGALASLGLWLGFQEPLPPRALPATRAPSLAGASTSTAQDPPARQVSAGPSVPLPVQHEADMTRTVLGAELPTRAPDASATASRAGAGQVDSERRVTTKRPGGARIAASERDRALRRKGDAPTTTISQVGSAVLVSTPGHTAEFGPAGLEFVPHDPRGVAVRASRLGYQLARVARGQNVLWEGGETAPVASGNQVRYDRAPGLVEHYLALDRGVEQLFSLAEIPAGEGDLVFRARVDTGLQGGPTESGGLRFAGDASPGVVFGRATAHDGLGRSTEADLVLAGSTLELRVPGEWLEDAQAPLLVDPLIGSDVNLTFFVGDEEWVDVAYNSLNNEFVLVCVSGGTNLVVSRLDGNGVVQQGGVILDSTVDAKARPAIAWSEASENKYLIAYERLDDVYVVVIDRTLSITSAVARIYDPVGAEVQLKPAVAYDPSRNSWLVVWDDSSQSASIDILGERVLTSGAQQGTVILRNLTPALGDPAVSYSVTTDRFLLAFNSGTDVAACTVDGPVATILASVTVSALTNTQNQPRVAWNSTANEWLVVFQSNDLGLTNDDVLGRRVSTACALVGSVVTSASTSEREQAPCVAYLAASNSYLIGHDRLNAVGSEWNVWAREHRADGTAVAAAFQASSSPTATSNEFFTAIAANSVQGEWLQAWEDGRAVTDFDVWGQRYSSDLIAPKVVRFDPQDKATGVPRDKQLFVDFSQDMNAATITGTNLRVFQNGATEITTKTVTYLPATRQARITVAGSWPASSTLRVNVAAAVANSVGVILGAAVEATSTIGTALSLPDADGDGVLDAEELALGLLPNDSDTDNDGLSDYQELYVTFTDPTKADTDGDGTLDGSDPTPNGTPTAPTNVPDPLPTAALKVTGLHPQGTFGSPAKAPASVLLAVTFNSPVVPGSVTATNLTLQDQTTLLNVALVVQPQPNPQTIVVLPSAALVTGRRYVLSVITGPTAIQDTAGQRVSVGGDAVFDVVVPTDGGFEPMRYLETLAMTPWERLPSTGPVGGGTLVVPSTRKLLHTETDVVTVGRGMPLELTRTYRNNADAASGIFGNNWHFTYDRGFEVIADTNGDTKPELRFRTADGKLVLYLSAASGLANAYAKPPGVFETTKAVTGNLFVTRDVHGLEHYYEFHQGTSTTIENPNALPVGAKGYLVKVRDHNGNDFLINRFAANHADRPMAINTIFDDLGRTTTFTYSTTVGQKNLCVKVEQYAGLASPRSWLYTYDANRSLIKVETPPADFKLENGSLATNTRRAQEYTYSLLAGEYLLTSVKDARANVTLRAFYDGAGDVLQLDHGAGLDVGTALFSYRLNTALGMNRATQVDRNGNVHELTHEDFTIASTWLIATSAVYTRGLHPTLPSTEVSGYTWSFTHNSAGLIVQTVSPKDEVWRCLRCTTCGCPEEIVWKAATGAALAIDPNKFMELDKVVTLAYENKFHGLARVIEPRGNNGAFVAVNPLAGIVASVENVATNTKRTYTNIDASKRNSFTTFGYYDHENIATRLAADTAAMGDTVTFARGFPQSHGRTTAGTYHDPPSATVFADGDADGFPDRGGNLIAVRGPQPKVLSTTLGDFTSRQAIETNFAYNQYGQRFLEVEPDGDRNRWEWFVGAFNLTTNPNRGFLKKAVAGTQYQDGDFTIVDGTPTGAPTGTGLELVESFTYDVYGHLLTRTNRRGFVTTSVVDVLGLVTKTTSPAPFSYEREYVYDANRNPVEERVQNVVPTDTNGDGIQDPGEQVEVVARADFIHTFAFNSANMLVRQDLDAFGSTPSTLTTVHEYDAMQLRVRTREPLGNVHAWRYDERNLLLAEVRGASDTLTSTTTRYDYDANGSLLQVIDDDGNTTPQVKLTYDTFRRPTAIQDELGNKRELTYDVGDFVRQEVAKGQLRGDPGDVFTSVLSNTLTEYDEAGRPFQSTRELWGAVELLAVQGLTRYTAPVDLSTKRVNAGELVTSGVAYSPDGLPLVTFDDNAHKVTRTYDVADRLTSVTDALSSSVAYVLDRNSNVIRTVETEFLSTGGSSDTFYAEAYFDELDRQIATVTHLGNTRRALYDSRDNVTQVSDAMAATGVTEVDDLRTAGEHGTFPQFAAVDPPATVAVNGRGNTTRLVYDGLSRLLSTTRDLRTDGTGGTTVVGQIVTSQSWDANSRLGSRTDPKGNVTTYVYDHQDRPTSEVYADLTFSRTTFNRDGTVDTVLDPRGVLEQFTYDANQRATSAAYSNLPPGAGQTTFKAWRWDGLDRRSRVEDNDTIGELTFDSLSRLVQDKQRISTGTPRTSSAGALAAEVQGTSKRVFDGVGNVLKKVYPSTTTFVQTFDAVDRLDTVKQGATTLASFVHVGQGGRRASRTYPVPGVQQSLLYDADRKVVRLDAVKTSTSQRVRGFTYVWDREGNRRQERRLTVNTNLSEGGGPGEFFRYDSAYRLVQDDRDVASAALDLVTHNVATVTAPASDFTKAAVYRLDAASNRLQTTLDGVTVAYDLSSDAQTKDLAMNQYTRIGATYQTHDLAGNTRSSSELGLQRFFDADNRLVQWTQGTKNVQYRYDADGRRVLKQDLGGSFATVVYFWDGWQTVEETNSAGTLVRQYVWGEGIDECLKASIPDKASDLDNDSITNEKVDLYYHHNSLGSVVAVTNAVGGVVESYRYSAFGKPTIYDEGGSVIASTYVEQPFMFTGARYDFEEGSGLYQMRHRFYDPVVGRFVSRDPLGLWGDPSQNGNGQGYCGHDPVNSVDPLGLGDLGAFEEALDAAGKALDALGEAGRTGGVDAVREAAKTFEAAQQKAAELWGEGISTEHLPEPERSRVNRRIKTKVRRIFGDDAVQQFSTLVAWASALAVAANGSGNMAPGPTTEGGTLIRDPVPQPSWQSESWSYDAATRTWTVTRTALIGAIWVTTVTVLAVVVNEGVDSVLEWVCGRLVLVAVGGGGGGGRGKADGAGGPID